MSCTESSAAPKRSNKRTVTGRCPSASEIARNVKHFETWSLHQGCEQACLSDVPKGLKSDIDKVLDVCGRIPRKWAHNDAIKPDHFLSTLAIPGFTKFLSDAHEECPQLFTDDDMDTPNLQELIIAFAAWQRLQTMRSQKEKWSEADFAENVYNILRSPAIRQSVLRVRCSISLPEPKKRLSQIDSASARVLNAKMISPDGAIFIPSQKIQPLSDSSSSLFKTMKRKIITKSSSKALFRDQATPCSQIPDADTFEFLSCVWEDKKPNHQLLEDAYRQNRMSSASALRHLHSLNVEAPVFGLVWSSGTVRAHVDWWHLSKKSNAPTISSAQCPVARKSTNGLVDGWSLDRPGDLLQVFFLIQNIDRWTVTRFHERVVDGLGRLTKLVEQDGHNFECWKRSSTASALAAKRKAPRASEKENMISVSTNSLPSSPEAKKGRRKGRK